MFDISVFCCPKILFYTLLKKNYKTIIFDKGSINFQRNAPFSLEYTKTLGLNEF